MFSSAQIRRVIQRRRRREEEDRTRRIVNYFRRRQCETTFFVMFLLISYGYDERVRRTVWSAPKSLHWWNTVVLATWGDDKWLSNFRMKKDTFMYLLNELRPKLTRRDTNYRRAIPPDQRLAITLWRLATNIEFRSLAEMFGVGRSTANGIFLDTISAIVEKLEERHIYIPTGQRLQDCIQRFEGRGFPQCVGAIDGSHIPVRAPPDNQRDFVNRKGFHSMVLQGIVDSYGQFIDIMVGYPGSCHDSRVLAECHFFTKLQNGTAFDYPSKRIGNTSVPPLLLGDPAYPLMRNLMKPFPDNGRLTPNQQLFNFKLSGCRIVVEHAFGRLKGRWRILGKAIDNDIENVPTIITACCILHNIVEIHANPFADDWLLDDAQVRNGGQVADGNPVEDTPASTVRNALTSFFAENH